MEQQFYNSMNQTNTDEEREFETKLIRTVYNFKWLYDNNHPDFSNVTRNRMSWASVAQICQKSFLECTNKWNSLLQTYFSGPSNNWVHLKDLQSLEPYLSKNIRIFNFEIKPQPHQKLVLLKELQRHSQILSSTACPNEKKNKIWLMITDICNCFPSGAKISLINWQKYWYDIKQEFSVQHTMRSKLQSMGTKLDGTTYTENDKKILEICGTSVNDTLEYITKALGRNNEFGDNKYMIVAKCKKCEKQPDEIIINGYCAECRKLPSCDICHIICVNSSVKRNVSNWSKVAKNLLPMDLATSNSLVFCNPCWTNLKKKASVEWKTCRICDIAQPDMQSLFDPSLTTLRQGFQTATHVTFSESDGLPGYICKVCKIQVQQLTNFYTKFWRTQTKLRGKHALQFVGLANVGQTIIKNGKVYYSVGAKIKPTESSVPIQPFDSKPNAINTLLPPYKIASVVTAQPQPGSSPATTVQQPFTTIPLMHKIPPASSDSEISSTTTNQSHVAAKTIATATTGTGYYDPPLAIKEIFSLQPNASGGVQKPSSQNSTTKPAIKVIPTAVLQQQQPTSTTKLDEVLSNKALTVTRKIMELPSGGNGPVQSPDNINVVAPLGKRAVTITKRIGVNLRGGMPSKFLPIKPKPAGDQPATVPQPVSLVAATVLVPPQSAVQTTISQPVKSASSKPAVFTINDYETIDDAVPVFCIPKNNSNVTVSTSENETIISAAEQQLLDFNPENAPVIKTEVFDDVGEQPKQPDEAPPHESRFLPAEPVPFTAPPILTQKEQRLEQQSPQKSAMKMIRVNGNMVVVKPHPYISEAYIPVDEKGKPKDKSTFIRKINNSEKSAGDETALPTVKSICGPIPVPLASVQVTKASVATPDQPSILQQNLIQNQQQQHQLNAKRPRKYWGTVEEFQVAPSPPPLSKPPSPPPIPAAPEPVILSKTRTPPRPALPPQTNQPTAASPINIPDSPPPMVQIKEEIDDNDVEIVSVTPAAEKEAPTAANKDANLFHPDAFELLNLTFGADVSQIFNNILEGSNDLSDYLYPKAAAGVAAAESEKNKKKSGSAVETQCKETEEQKKRKIDNNKEPIQPDEEQQKELPKMKHLRIRIKRLKKSNQPYLRLRRSCVQSTTTQFTSTEPKRKSKRLK